MTHVAHACPVCRALTIFVADATYPRRCARCSKILSLTHAALASASLTAAGAPSLRRTSETRLAIEGFAHDEMLSNTGTS